MTAKVEENQSVLKERSAAPPTPASGNALLYPNASSAYRQIDDTGTERPLIFSMGVEDVSASVSVSAATILEGFRRFAESKTAIDVMLHYIPRITSRQFTMFDPSSVVFTGAETDTLGGYTQTAFNATAIVQQSDGQTRQFTTSTTNNVNAGITAAASSLIRSYWMDTVCEALMYVKLRTDSVLTNQAIMVGLFSADAIADDIGATQGAYFRYSTSVPDPGWVGIAHASSANRNVSANLGNIAVSTTYELLMYFTASGIHFSVNGAAATLVAYPTGFGGLGVAPQVSVLTKDLIAKSIEVYTYYVEII